MRGANNDATPGYKADIADHSGGLHRRCHSLLGVSRTVFTQPLDL